ncbi:RNA-directed DNA polymerase from mobile element jockey-like [Brachionus plicatilis]|uniref:RNA-directed DNA polymerase from mobile element jockey-like n=1 Tax=Brachionus plicatilis TaxID=10195 RepID=A0A3M7Q1I2_BRAPC|nr:RNA-directed DNA polymerase from mobile element jockey-like [Brachionus plicatilis]
MDKLFSSLIINSPLLTQKEIISCADLDKAVLSFTNCIQKSIQEATSNISIPKIVTKSGNKKLKEKVSLKFGNESIPYEQNPKFLGITLDKSLSFTKHINNLKHRAQSRVNMLKHLKGRKWGLNNKLLLITYKALIRSILEYSPFISLITCESNKKTIESFQTKALRTISRSSSCLLSNTKLLNQFNLETIQERCKKLASNYLTRALRGINRKILHVRRITHSTSQKI